MTPASIGGEKQACISGGFVPTSLYRRKILKNSRWIYGTQCQSLNMTLKAICLPVIFYISWEMTPTSIGGEKQAGISGGSQSPS